MPSVECVPFIRGQSAGVRGRRVPGRRVYTCPMLTHTGCRHARRLKFSTASVSAVTCSGKSVMLCSMARTLYRRLPQFFLSY